MKLEDKEQLVELLKNQVVVFNYTKINGEPRQLTGTLKPELLPVQTITETQVKKEPNPNILAVYDVEKDGWRSMKIENIIDWVVLSK